MNPRGQSADNDLVNLGLIGIAALGCLAAALRLAGTVTAWATIYRGTAGRQACAS